MNPTAFPFAKPIYGAAIAFVGALGTALTDGAVSPVEWCTVAGATLAAGGAIFSVSGTEMRSGVADTQVPADEVFPRDALDGDEV